MMGANIQKRSLEACARDGTGVPSIRNGFPRCNLKGDCAYKAGKGGEFQCLQLMVERESGKAPSEREK